MLDTPLISKYCAGFCSTCVKNLRSVTSRWRFLQNRNFRRLICFITSVEVSALAMCQTPVDGLVFELVQIAFSPASSFYLATPPISIYFLLSITNFHSGDVRNLELRN
jgi:hypothetical protein